MKLGVMVKLILIFFAIVSIVDARIQQAVCVPDGVINVTILSDSGKWIGASIIDKEGNIVDIAPQKRSFGVINYNFRFSSRAVKFRVSTWKGYDGKYMQHRLSDTGWKQCNGR